MLGDSKALIRTLQRCSPDSQSGNAVHPPAPQRGVFSGFVMAISKEEVGKRDIC
jgi:hypothetical protein